MNKKQKDLHLLSLPVFALLLVSFWLLGGGSSSKTSEVVVATDAINTSLPSASKQDMAEGRLAAMKATSERETKEKRRMRMQENSFSWLDMTSQGTASSKEEASTAEEKVESAPAVNLNTSIPETKPVAVVPKTSETSKKSDKQSRKEAIMQEKRKNLEQALGVDFATYGLDGVEQKQDEAPEVKEEPPVDEAPAVKRGFYGLDKNNPNDDGHVKAVVHGLHKDVTSGSVIKMRLLEPVKAENVEIPRNSFVYGKLSFGSGRAMVRIENINFRNRIIPFTGSIYDRDGFEGLYVPDNAISETKKNATGQAVSSTDVRVNSPVSMLNSAANAVTGAIKSAVSSSVRETKITISSNYLITIKRDK